MRKVLASKGLVIFLSVSFLEMFFLEAKGKNGVARSYSWPSLGPSEEAGVNNRRLLPVHSYPTLDGVCISAIKEVSVIFIFPNEYEIKGVLEKFSNAHSEHFCNILKEQMTLIFQINREKNPFYFFYINQKLTCLTVCGDEPDKLGGFLEKIKSTFPHLVQVISFGICGCPILEIPRGTVMISMAYRHLHRVTGVAELLRKKGKTPFLSQGNNHFLSKFFKEIETSVVLKKVTDILNKNDILHVPCHNCTVFELLSDPNIAEGLQKLSSDCIIVNQEDSCCYEAFGEKYLPIRVVSDHCGCGEADELEENKLEVLERLYLVALLVIQNVNGIVAL